MHLSEKGPKGRFFASDKLDNHTIEGKGKNKQIERAKRKKGGGKKKSNGRTHSSYIFYFGDSFLAKKNAWRKRFIWQKRFQKCSMVKKKKCHLQRQYIYLLQLLLESRMRKRLLECSCDNGFLLLINLNF